MIFACPKCGRVTSSSLSMESGGYWNKYNRGGPWGCVSCGQLLTVRCQEPMCGAVGTPETIPNGYCDQCQTTSCAHCREQTDRQYLVANLCPACLRLEVQCSCPQCGNIERYSAGSRGQEVKCSKCNETIIVPEVYQDKLLPKQPAPVEGHYRCTRCGPDGEGAEIVRDYEGNKSKKSEDPFASLFKSILGPQIIDEARKVAAMPLAVKKFAKNELLPECPNGCGAKTHWEMMNPAAKGATLVGAPVPVRKCLVEASNRESAVIQALGLGIQQHQIIAVKLVRREETGKIKERDLTTEGALDKAKKKIPSDAIMVGEPRILDEPCSGKVECRSSSEVKAHNMLLGLKPSGATMSKIVCDQKPVKLMWILLRRGIWSGRWTRDCILEVDYKRPGQHEIRALAE